MTTTALAPALETYLQYPMDDGDAVLLLDDTTCLELEQPADGEGLDLDRLARTLAASGTQVLLAVARTGRRPRPDDLLLWTGLGAALTGSGVTLLPLALLPAS